MQHVFETVSKITVLWETDLFKNLIARSDFVITTGTIDKLLLKEQLLSKYIKIGVKNRWCKRSVVSNRYL